MSLAFDHNNPYPSRRSATYADRGMVAASQPQASQAGRAMLALGGNAIDAAIDGGGADCGRTHRQWNRR